MYKIVGDEDHAYLDEQDWALLKAIEKTFEEDGTFEQWRQQNQRPGVAVR
jgi:hypothetical protein